MLWLALFYLAPLVTLLRLSLSNLPSRFAVEAEFDWKFGTTSTRSPTSGRSSSGRSSTQRSRRC
jgi:hypothetical protein